MATLITVTTDRLRLTWSGPLAPPDPTAPSGMLRVRALRTGAAPQVQVGSDAAALDTPLRFAEQTTYQIFARAEAPQALRHVDPVAMRGIEYHDGGRVLSGRLNFEGQVGRSRFVVEVGGEDELAIEVEVFPTKVTFAEAEAMRTDIDEALAGLAFEYLRSTEIGYSLSVLPPRRATWLSMLRRVLPDLEAAIEHITARPYRDLLRRRETIRAEKVQRPSTTLRRAVRQGRGSGALTALRTEVEVRSLLPEHRSIADLDTPEHRWLRSQLESVRARLSTIQADESRLPRSVRRRQVLNHLSDAERRISRLLRLEPFAEAGAVTRLGPPTQRLLTAPGYGEAYRACQQLAFSLALADGPVPHATRDLHLLYEMWCYLTVLLKVSSVLRCPVSADGFFRSEHQGVRMLLRRGGEHATSFGDGVRRVVVTYTPRFAAWPGLLAQRPDLLLTVEGSTTRHFVLDAKYRRDDTAGYRRRFGAPGPPEDALGDLHRYRDAIRDRSGARIIEQAVALYPYRADEAFVESRLWTAIEPVGVGALPFVPGATDHLTRWLAEVLEG